MVHSKLVGSYSGKGKVTQVDKYGNVTCDCVCVVLKVVKTCGKNNVHLLNVTIGDKQNNALIVKQSDSDEKLWYGVGEGVTQFLNFKLEKVDDCDVVVSVDYSFSSYVSGNSESWGAGDFVLTPCKCTKKTKCGCDCERS
jgi:hypothetical protein